MHLVCAGVPDEYEYDNQNTSTIISSTKNYESEVFICGDDSKVGIPLKFTKGLFFGATDIKMYFEGMTSEWEGPV